MTEPGTIAEIPAADLGALVQEGVVLIDVRMPDEYVEAHVPGAVLIPLPELPDRHGEIPAADTVYVICRSGARSLKASEFLITTGRTPVNIAGGTLGWIEAGHPVVSGPEPG